ncbi:MAG: hypothetical protein CSA22_06040 [Deltaproteobacteria bacterium]|nr:MAG: hypothetical protein CSA22_06040 [Deltaproteobacteria bacterium]
MTNKNPSKAFTFDLPDNKLQTTFADIFSKHKGDWSTIKAELAITEGFSGKTLINKLEYTHNLVLWSDDNAAVVSLFQKDPQINSLRDIALTLDKPAFVNKVKRDMPGKADLDKENAALKLRRKLFTIEPTAMLINLIRNPQLSFLNDAVGANIVTVLNNQPDFNIRTTSVYKLFNNDKAFKDITADDDKAAVKAQLKILQRLTAVSTDPDAVPVLYNAKIQSAMQISALPRKQFIAALKNGGLAETTLAQIHHNAQQTRVRNEQFIMSFREAAQPTHVAFIDKSLSAYTHSQTDINRPAEVNINTESTAEIGVAHTQELLDQYNLSWDLLFADADLCECGECNSVYSPASYFVELLNYLRNNNLDPNSQNNIAIKPDPKDISDTPLEKLFDRRPDLGCLELTCENTHTLIPYVDLVNEVMENYVAYKKLKPFNVDDETSGELLAEPQHTEYQAYCLLKNEVYPFTLPYHQPIDAARIYLDFLDTSRYEVIRNFRKNHAGPDVELTRLQDQALDRAVDAECLKLTREEYVILTRECFENIDLMRRLKDNPAMTQQEYWQIIGGKTVHEYYGYKNEATMLGNDGLTLIKPEFLRRTGIDYADLVELLKTQTLNPCLPKGRAKAIMESLHFSYRFLQNYAKVFGLEKMAEALVMGEELAELLPKLKEQIELLTNKKAPVCPASADDTMQICDKDILCWVKCYFEKVGKMIVIENGRGCVDGVINITDNITGHLGSIGDFRAPKNISLIIKNCNIYIYNPREELIGHIDKDTGKITFENNVIAEGIQPDSLKNLSFIGNRGEKGVFHLIDGEIYLIFTEQQDTCDLDTALLQHLDGTPLTVNEYDKIHRFIRLWRRLGWSIDEVDQAIVGLSNVETSLSDNNNQPAEILCDDNDDCSDSSCDDCEDCAEALCIDIFDITPELIHQLCAVNHLLDQTGLELIKLLSFWTTISCFGDHSLYRRLFLTHNVLGIDKIFKADARGNYLTADVKLTDHLPAVMASLNLSADDIQAIMQSASLDDKLTLANLSLLYRYRLLARVLGLRIPAFISILPLFGDIFKSAEATRTFLKRWAKMEDAGFTYQQLNFIIRDVDDDKRPFSPDDKTVLLLSKQIYDGLNAIDSEHADLAADPDITDPAAQLFNIQQKATAELVRTKASLLFDSPLVDQLLAYLQGTAVYTTNAPKDLDFTIPDGKTLKNKLSYDKTLGSVQITGILTGSEVNDYNNLSSELAWADALARIEKQQAKAFKELFAGIFEEEKTKTNSEKEALKAIILTGDISVAVDTIADGDPDPNTAPQKRVAFFAIFLPYLRQQLTHRFIIDNLSAYAGLAGKVVDLLVSDILKSGTPSVSIYDVFEKIKDSVQPAADSWNGYLIPAADSGVTIIVKNSDNAPVVYLDGAALTLTAQEDPTNEWWSGSLQLEAGKLYAFATNGVPLENIFWKTPTSTISAIPSSALIPDFAPQQAGPSLIALKKAAMLVSGFELSTDEIDFLNNNKGEFAGLDFNALSLKQWLRLEAYIRLRNTLPQGKINILDFWQWTYDATADVNRLSEKIADLTTWKKENIDKLIAANHFNLAGLSDYSNEKNLLKLQQALKIADKTGADIDLLFDWGYPTSNFNRCRNTAESIKNSIRARYKQTDWEEVIKPLHDKLRNHQRDALTAYLLQQRELIAWNITDADGLFEYFLIDVQMDACMETSRIKQAISSVQLFIQRCFLGLEEAHNQIKPDVLDRERWEWMQRYRVWEANRKVFLYPENWIESNLRDDKSPFFKELESELLQKDISKQNVSDALKSYLYKVDTVANMEVVGLYIEGEKETDGRWHEDSKLHVFSRTRNAPYSFYYRYLALDEMNWYPWEKMQVDIPSYDCENPLPQEESSNQGEPSPQTVPGNGCYLTPVVWNNRLLVFFPQIMKKTKPNPDSTSGSFEKLGSSNTGIEKSTPISYYEIKMAWSEYRNGKWTQKQLSNDAVISDHIDSTHDIQFFKFVPIVNHSDKVIINVDDHRDSDGGYKGAFEFDGNSLKIGTPVHTESMPIDYFNHSSQKMYSWQIEETSRVNTDIYFHADNNEEKVFGINGSDNDFYHPTIRNLFGHINAGNLAFFFQQNLNSSDIDFGRYMKKGTNSYHELKGPYSLYNWELFFHTPILLADALSKAQHYEEAMKWFHFVFNPMAEEDSSTNTPDKRFWQFSPFRKIDSKQILESIFHNLQPNTADDAITEWRNKPFMPHVVARSRPVAYMKWVVMKYIDNLIAWGDYLFRQDTIETVNQASQLYVLAGHILGPKPMSIPKRGNIKPQTYLGLLDKWDAFGNAMVELELAAPFSNQTAPPFELLPAPLAVKELVSGNIYGTASALYFCIPNNPNLLSYWDTVADRLYKIRHCLNIKGIFRKLSLFEPPIDPALLVKAAAQGLSIASVLNDLNTPMPNYRFYYLLQKALELCSELKSLGGAMLSAIEKQDNEHIALLRAKHENVMQNLVMEIKKKQLEEAQKNIASLQQNRKAPEARMKYYLKLSGLDESLVPDDTADFNEIPNDIVTVDGDSGLKLIRFEKEDMDKAGEAQRWQEGIGKAEALAAIFHAIPNNSADAKPWGVGAGVVWGGLNLGNVTQAGAKVAQIRSNDLSYQSTSAGKKGGFTRALQDRIFQANAAGYELKQIDKQILAQQIRIDIANQEITNQQKSIDNATEVEAFLKNKYSNEELYTWMRGKLKTLYHQVYSLAYDLAKKAEKTYCFERGLSNTNFIQPGYFDAGRDGLLAGEQLYVGLKQLEAAYQNERGYDYEITKPVSLYQLDPLAVIQLREVGQCEFELPEAFFDLDYPGHYKRRIKSLSLSIPCVVGPYTGVNATLRLLENKFRNTAIGGKAYVENSEEADDRFSSSLIPIDAVAVSSAQNDSGVFELNFKDERYLPFEGAGVISRWRLELPSVRQFDYQSISDVVMHLKYTASEGGDYLKREANKSVLKQINTISQSLNQTGLHVTFNMRHELSNEWTLLKNTGTAVITIDKAKLPYIAQLVSKTSIESVMFLANMVDSQPTCSITIDDTVIDLQKISNELKFCRGFSEDIQLDQSFNLSVDAEQLNKIQALFIVVKLVIKK